MTPEIRTFGDLTRKKFDKNSYVGSPDFGKFNQMGIDMKIDFKSAKTEEKTLENLKKDGLEVVS